MAQPTCTIIAGPNGAGKTTLAMRYLPDVAGHRRFVNADLIAAGLSPLAPGAELVQASRLFLAEIQAHIQRRKDFAFETTLAGRGYFRLIQRLRTQGWRVVLVYLALPDVSVSEKRVTERVRYGGHDIRLVDIRRRFPRSLVNLFDSYGSACDLVLCHDNTGDTPIPGFEQSGDMLSIYDANRFGNLEQQAAR